MVLSSIVTLFTAPLEFLYWIKWAIAYVGIRIHNTFHSRRFHLYDFRVVNDPIKLAFLVPQEEKDIESPHPESHLLEHADEVTFYGVNSKSECVLVRIARGVNQVADAWVYLKLANGKTYSLTETMGYQQSSDGIDHTFSCGKLQMHYLSPMRKWRIFYCGMLKQTSDDKHDQEDIVFVKFVFLWKASSDVYDCTLDTNPEGFADAMARSEWKVPFVPPIKKFTEALDFYAQTGVVTGTVSINDGPEYEMYLFGEKMRSLGKSANIAGCKFTNILGSIPANGLSFHLTHVSAPYMFKNAPFGFVVDPDGNLLLLKELDINIKPFTVKRTGSSFRAGFKAGEEYEIYGNIAQPIVFYSGQGWSGFLELSYIDFTYKNRKGSGLILTGEVYKEPKSPPKLLPSIEPPKVVPLTLPFSDEASHFGEISGGKGSSLGKLTKLSNEDKSFIVPKGIIVTTSAYAEFLTPEIHEAVKHLEDIAYGNETGDLTVACKKVSRIVENTSLPKKICHSIIEDLKEVFKDEVNQMRFAVRSSATGEDTSAMSAAGQMDTFLGVQGLREIFSAVKKCWASQFGHIAVEYKRRYGQVLNSPMAVVIQEMVACEVSGVMFTCDPVTNNPSIITITANYGLGETVVSGTVEPDTFTLKRKETGNLEMESVLLGSKHQRIVMQEFGGTITEDLGENSKDESCLTKETAIRLSKLGVKIEKYYKSSRDIEWGILNDKIYILQSRPVTNAAAETDEEIKHEFDTPLRCENEYVSVANIGEVMPGAMSPLGVDLMMKFFCGAMQKQAYEKDFVDNLFKSNYFQPGILTFCNHMMMTVVEIITRYGVNTAASKGFMISIYGRILDDPELLDYAYEKVKEGVQQSWFFNLSDVFVLSFDDTPLEITFKERSMKRKFYDIKKHCVISLMSTRQRSETKEGDMGICCHSREAAVRKEEAAVHFTNVREDQTTDNRVIAVALYPLESTNRFLLKFERGDKLIIEDDSDPDWYMARHVNEERRGFVPKSYLNLDRFAGDESWFFDDTNRADAERLLLQPENEPGAFLVRHSHSQGSYALSIKDIDANANEVLIRHYKIRTLDRGGFFISPRDSFSTLKDLVTYYSNADGLCRRLEKPCLRPRPAILGPLPNSRDEYEVPFESLEFVRTLGKGNFGEVFYGFWNGTVEVAIKRLISNGVGTDEFRREVAVMKAICHPKIVRLYAICTEKEPFCIVMEYMCNGNLQHYLKTDLGKRLRLPSLVNISAQIADGMMYLEANNMIHRDLAARNILVGDGGIVKLADFGLARIVDEAVYVASGGKLPIKWTAPEAYTTGEFTIKSDVWSFGIVLYEIFTHGGTPYLGMKNAQVSQLITKHDYRMPKPSDPDCTDAVYDIMTKCWKKDPKDRPTFEFLYHFFTDFPVSSEGSYREAD